MADLLCPFSAPIVKQDFACPHAQEIIRRGGTEIACQQAQVHNTCSRLHGAIKASALQAMALEDNLLTLPHNVLVKIQYGCLLGLKALLTRSEEGIDDIAALVSDVMAKYDQVDAIPMASINQAIIEHKTQRRRKK